MANWLYHYVVGNDVHPGFVAAARAVLGAVLLGGAAVIDSWQGGGTGEEMAQIGAKVSVGFLILRAGFEGALDVWKKNGTR